MKKLFQMTALLLCVLLLCSCGNAAVTGAEELSDDPEDLRTEAYEDVTRQIDEALAESKYTDYPTESSETPYHYIPETEKIDVVDFTTDSSGYPVYRGDLYLTEYGIDVSEHQGEVNWQQVAESGVTFAMIRVGYRGYTKGSLNADAYFEQYVEGARENGIKVGVYFFSQAITVAEAEEEADFVLEALDGMELDFPVGFDWERIVGDKARTDNVTFRRATDCAKAFCEKITEAGYECNIYCIGNADKCMFYLEELTDYDCWFFLDGANPSVVYDSFMWQYTTKGFCPGVNTECDMDMLFTTRSYLKNPDPKTE